MFFWSKVVSVTLNALTHWCGKKIGDFHFAEESTLFCKWLNRIAVHQCVVFQRKNRETMRKLKIGIIDLVAKGPTRSLWARTIHANLASIMPQEVARCTTKVCIQWPSAGTPKVGNGDNGIMAAKDMMMDICWSHEPLWGKHINSKTWILSGKRLHSELEFHHV